MTRPNIHPDTARFIAAICENLPMELSSDVMEGWIQNPRALRRALEVLLPPVDVALIRKQGRCQ